MTTHHRRNSTATLSARAPTTLVSPPRLVLRRRLYYSSLRSRVVVLFGLVLFTFVAFTFVFNTWMPRSPSFERERVYDYRPSSRAFRYDGVDPRRTSSAHAAHAANLDKQDGYSFTRHPTQELGAVVGFLATLASNSIPLTIDPSAHIDPELVLGFNTRSNSAEVVEEVGSIVADTWARNPVVVFSELRTTAAPASREVKKLVESFSLDPVPTIFEVDDRADAEVLRPLLRRLTGQPSLPVVLIGGQSFGSLDDLREAQMNGRLSNAIASAGAVIDGAKTRKKRHH